MDAMLPANILLLPPCLLHCNRLYPFGSTSQYKSFLPKVAFARVIFFHSNERETKAPVMCSSYRSALQRSGALKRQGLGLRRDLTTAEICFLTAYLHHNGISDSEFESSSHKQDEYLTKIFDEILWQVLSKDSKYSSKEDARTTAEPLTWEDANETHSAENKEPSLFNRDVSPQLTAEDNETLQKSTRGASRESLPCGQLLSFLQKNIISATVAMAAVLLVTVLVVFTLVTYKRRRQTKYPPANMTYNIFIMNGKSLWQNSQDKDLKKFMGKPKHLKYNSFV
ncbi:uncharacterized protein C2orf92 homolog isoform X2 [Mus musculus]|uniref:uncharacterized protein C2orf92 homolog isoform X2 n=2 Tax=Mus musculus TaxID=10090 RepID=UPI0016777BBB|nr:uncharacterized protein C2orf92 homolog isoform X2 [Mus musculus]